MLLLQVLPILYGLIIGSFLNVCIYRMPREQSIAFPPSHCTSCGERIRAYDLIPLVSWLLLGGKCRFCNEKISWRYPLVELINGLAYGFIFYWQGWTVEAMASAFLFSVFLAITFIDLEHYLIPDGLVITLLVVGISFNIYIQNLSWLSMSLGFLFGGGSLLLLAVISQGGMGGGDIKLSAAMGLWLGWPFIAEGLFLGALLGSIVGIFLIALKITKREDPIPFGPFLALGFLLTYWHGNLLADIYWSFLR